LSLYLLSIRILEHIPCT